MSRFTNATGHKVSKWGGDTGNGRAAEDAKSMTVNTRQNFYEL